MNKPEDSTREREKHMTTEDVVLHSAKHKTVSSDKNKSRAGEMEEYRRRGPIKVGKTIALLAYLSGEHDPIELARIGGVKPETVKQHWLQPFHDEARRRSAWLRITNWESVVSEETLSQHQQHVTNVRKLLLDSEKDALALDYISHNLNCICDSVANDPDIDDMDTMALMNLVRTTCAALKQRGDAVKTYLKLFETWKGETGVTLAQQAKKRYVEGSASTASKAAMIDKMRDKQGRDAYESGVPVQSSMPSSVVNDAVVGIKADDDDKVIENPNDVFNIKAAMEAPDEKNPASDTPEGTSLDGLADAFAGL